MPGQNMYNLALVYPLAFKLLQIYFPPIKFFMRQYWLCSLVLPQQNGAGGSNLTEHPAECSVKPGRCRPPRPKVNHKALLFLHARQWLKSQRNTL